MLLTKISANFNFSSTAVQNRHAVFSSDEEDYAPLDQEQSVRYHSLQSFLMLPPVLDCVLAFIKRYKTVCFSGSIHRAGCYYVAVAKMIYPPIVQKTLFLIIYGGFAWSKTIKTMPILLLISICSALKEYPSHLTPCQPISIAN